MPKKKPNRKKKKKSAQSARPARAKPSKATAKKNAAIASERYADDYTFMIVVLAGFVSGGALGTGFKEPNGLGFLLVLAMLFASRHCGYLFRVFYSLSSLKSVAHSVGDLKNSIGKDSISEDAERKRIKWKLLMLVYAQLVGFFAYSWLYHSPETLGLLLLSLLTLIGLRSLPLSHPRHLVLHALYVVVLVSVLVPLGLYTQAGRLIAETYLVGFVPGTMLAAALVAKHAVILQKAGWQRSETVMKAKGQPRYRPLGIPRLYASFLVSGIFLSVVLTMSGLVPQPMMFSAALALLVPKVANGFLSGSASDEQVYTTTVKHAAIASSLMLILGLLSRVP